MIESAYESPELRSPGQCFQTGSPQRQVAYLAFAFMFCPAGVDDLDVVNNDTNLEIVWHLDDSRHSRVLANAIIGVPGDGRYVVCEQNPVLGCGPSEHQWIICLGQADILRSYQIDARNATE